MTFPKVFDGHSDFLNFALTDSVASQVKAFGAETLGHIDVPRAGKGGFGGGMFAVFVPSPADVGSLIAEMQSPPYALPNPELIEIGDATPCVLRQIAQLDAMERAGHVRICTTADEIAATLSNGPMATVLHFEGAEAIDPDFHALEVFHRAGLRSLGPVWSRNTRYAEGVPFCFPASPDIGGGLTEDGRRLVAACNRMRIAIDLSHINEAGFWDIAKLTDAPLIATHSNAHAVCPHSRNLTDKQLAAIAESDGMVGLNFAAAFLRDDGKMDADVPIEQMIRHLDHMIGIVGEDRIGIGSDFDGAVVPEVIGDCAGLPVLQQGMADHGYSAELIAKISHGNWLRVLRKTWGA